ncbi:MAG: iron ABC transporter permease [Coriobacteriales bacterium]|nr:iron ABC transporter permease [Coriobacteriales bacterium]
MDEKEAKAAAAEIAREQELAREEELAARHAKWAKKGRKERFAAEDRTIEGKKQVPLVAILLFLGAVVIVLSIISLCVGRFHVDIQTTLRILLSPFTGETDGWTANEWTVITTIRIPRVIAACLVGAALALSGASYQGVFQNPLVSPDILGVSYGACVGAALAILLNLGGNTILVQLFAFVGGIITVFVTVSIPKLMHRHSNVVMVLSGVIVGGFMSSILGLMKYVADPDTQLQEITYWQLGSIAKVDFDLLLYTAPVMIVAGIILLAMRWRLNLISLGEEEARSLGVDLRKERLIIIVAATILTASAVSVAGTIGWVGLIIPHMARRLVGADNKRLIPTVILVAMAFMLLIDLFARNISGWEVPLGVLTGLIGAPLFGYILVRQREVD